MAKKKTTTEEELNLDNILFKCRDILRQAKNSGSFFEKRDLMLTLVFLRFIGEKFEDGVKKLKADLIAQGLDPKDEAIKAAFFDDPSFTDGKQLCRAGTLPLCFTLRDSGKCLQSCAKSLH